MRRSLISCFFGSCCRRRANPSPTLTRPAAPLAACVQRISSVDKDFSRSQTVTYTVTAVISQKWCNTDTMLLHTTKRKCHMAYWFMPLPVTLDGIVDLSPVACLLKCYSTNTRATFRTVSTVQVRRAVPRRQRSYIPLQVAVVEWLARLTAVWEDPGSNHTADGCVYRDSRCDTQSWARAAHLYCSP